jgi:hypothetical protein
MLQEDLRVVEQDILREEYMVQQADKLAVELNIYTVVRDNFSNLVMV